jgi:hypothetical protein
MARENVERQLSGLPPRQNALKLGSLLVGRPRPIGRPITPAQLAQVQVCFETAGGSTDGMLTSQCAVKLLIVTTLTAAAAGRWPGGPPARGHSLGGD